MKTITVSLTIICLASLALLTGGATETPEAGCCRGKAAAAENICPVLIGTKIPEATLRTSAGPATALSSLTSKKPTVLVFYRGGWCMYCTTQLGQLKKIEQDILDMGYQIIAISPDQPARLRESIDKHELNYTLLSDSTAQAAKDFGLAFRVNEKTLVKYRDYGIDLNAASGWEHTILPVPAVFLVDTEGMIHFSYVNPNYSTRLAPELLLTAVKVSRK